MTAEDTPITFNPSIWITDVDQTTGGVERPGPGHGRVRGRGRYADGDTRHRRHDHRQWHDRVDLEGTITNVNTVLGP